MEKDIKREIFRDVADFGSIYNNRQFIVDLASLITKLTFSEQFNEYNEPFVIEETSDEWHVYGSGECARKHQDSKGLDGMVNDFPTKCVEYRFLKKNGELLYAGLRD